MLLNQLAAIGLGLLTIVSGSFKLDVPVINQYPDYPSGCESVAAVELLQYWDFDITVDDFIDKYLDKTTDWSLFYQDDYCLFDRYFFGNPRSSEGWECYPPVIEEAINQYFDEIGETRFYVCDLSGSSFDDILNEIASGYPVMVWISNKYVPLRHATYGSTSYYYPNHVAVLTGYNDESRTVYLSDSISGSVEISYDTVMSIYDARQLALTVKVANPAQMYLFDAEYYYNEYSDLAELYGNQYDENDLWQHYINYGVAEGRSLNAEFNVASYRTENPDLDAAFGDDWEAYAEHYISHGISEGR